MGAADAVAGLGLAKLLESIAPERLEDVLQGDLRRFAGQGIPALVSLMRNHEVRLTQGLQNFFKIRHGIIFLFGDLSYRDPVIFGMLGHVDHADQPVFRSRGITHYPSCTGAVTAPLHRKRRPAAAAS